MTVTNEGRALTVAGMMIGINHGNLFDSSAQGGRSYLQNV